jgi:hypothetical protein
LGFWLSFAENKEVFGFFGNLPFLAFYQARQNTVYSITAYAASPFFGVCQGVAD